MSDAKPRRLSLEEVTEHTLRLYDATRGTYPTRLQHAETRLQYAEETARRAEANVRRLWRPWQWRTLWREHREIGRRIRYLRDTLPPL